MAGFRQMFRRRLNLLAAVLCASAVATAVRAAPPEVLQDVPGDAYGVIVINNAHVVANKISNAATRLSLPIPPDLIGWATRSIGIAQGFDANGSAAVVFLKPAPDKAQGGYFNSVPPVVALLPTTNSKDLLAPFKPGDADKDGISEVTLPSNPDEKGYVATVDNKWVALAQNRDDLLSYLGRKDSFAKTASADTLKIFNDNDFVIWGDVEKITAGTEKLLDDEQTEINGIADLANVTGKGDPVAAAAQKLAISTVFSGVKEFQKDSKASLIAIRLTDSGITLGIVGDFKAGTPFGNFVSDQGSVASSGAAASLKGLPGGNFLAAGGMEWNPKSVIGIVSNFGDQLLADPAVAKSDQAPQLKQLIDQIKTGLASTQGMHMVLLDPAAGGQNGMFNGSILVDTSDPQKYVDMETQMVKNNAFANQFNGDIKTTATLSPDAVTVKGVHLSRITVKLSLRDETPNNPIQPEVKAMMPMMDKMYGPDGLSMYMGIVGKRVVLIYGSDTVTLESSIAAAQGNTDELSSNPLISGSKDQVADNPIAVAYLPITRWFTLAQSIVAPAAAGQAPAPAAPPSPSVVASAGVTGTMMTYQLHVPIATILGVEAAVAQLERAMTGGAPGAPAAPNALP